MRSLGLGLLLSACQGSAICRQELLSQNRGLFSIWAVGGRFLAALDRCFEAAEKFLAGLASFEVLFNFFAGEVIQLSVEIIGESGKHLFTASAIWEKFFSRRSRDPLRLVEFLAYKEAGAMKSYADRSGAEAGDFRDLVVRQAFHVSQDDHDSIVRRDSANSFP